MQELERSDLLLKDEDYYNDFLLKDFEQQYQEYTRAETSRNHHVQFFISLVLAVLGFFGALYQIVGFPAPDIFPIVFLLLFSMILFFIGYFVANICISTWVSQVQTVKYLNDVARYFLGLKQKDKLEASRKRTYSSEEDWISEKTSFIQLVNIITFLLGVLVALALYSSFRIIFVGLELSGVTSLIDFPKWLFFRDYITWSQVISAIVGATSLVVAYKMIKQKTLKDLRKRQEEANKEIS